MNKHSIIAGIAVGAGLMIAASAANAGIINTKHNLGSTNVDSATPGVNNFSDTTSVCVFCHTPHGTTAAIVPLWNKGITTTGYTAYSSGTLDGSSTDTAVVSVTLACLSCHDGTQAMDSMINAPGSGGWSSVATDQGYTPGAGSTMDASGRMGVGLVSNLTQDLSDDHPVRIQYAGGGCDTTTTCNVQTNHRDPSFNTGLTDASGLAAYFDNVTTNSKMDSEEIRLYIYDAIGGNPKVMVECASCHDPHTETVTFLRAPTVEGNVGSVVCTTCHNK